MTIRIRPPAPPRLPLRHCLPAALCLAALALGPPPRACAQLAPPSLRIVRPFGIVPGTTASVEIRGKDLDGASALWIDGESPRSVGLAGSKLEPGDGRRGQKLTAKVAWPADLPPGPVRVRVASPQGLSNAATVWVGRRLPTKAEVEPNHQFRRPQPVPDLVAIEAEIEPGDDVDVFAVEAKAGDAIVAEAIAARAGSGLDALVTIFAPDGRELAAADDTFGRDAAAWAVAPKAGRYLVQIQDADGRNRDNNIEQRLAREYRLEIGRLPLVTSAFPPGGRQARPAELRLLGANLPEGGVFRLDPTPGSPPGDLVLQVPGPLGPSNPFPIRIGEEPETLEAEPNDEFAQAGAVTVPAAINGTLEARLGGDVDFYHLKAAPGAEGDFRITAFAARVGSPADPVLTLLDPDKGDAQGEDDDRLGRDARLERRIDAKSGAILSVRDYFGRGGPGYVYRLEVERIGPRGLTIVPDLGGRTLPRRGSLALPIALERRNFEGPVTVVPGVLPPGVSAAPVTLPARAVKGFVVLSASAEAPPGPFPLRLSARDVPAAPEFRYVERSAAAPAPGQGQPRPDPTPFPALSIVEPAPLGVALGPAEVVASPGGAVSVRLSVERLGSAAKKAIKVRLLVPEGGLDGFEPVAETTVPAGSSEATLALKARPDAAPRRVSLSALAWFEGGTDAMGVNAAPVTLVVPERR